MKPVLLDGPMGTEIERRGGEISMPLWSAKGLLDNPDMVKQIHLDYINAGAEVITTNTFRTQERTFRKINLKNYGKSMTQLAVELAQGAKKKSQKSIKIAGSISPLEDCYSPELVPEITELKVEHKDMAQWLYDAGIDIFLIETMNTIKEAKIAFEMADNYDIPIWMGMTVDNNGKILSGESWNDLFQAFDNLPDVVFVNCSSRIGTEKALLELNSIKVKSVPELNIGFYPNYLFEMDEGREILDLRQELFDNIDQWLSYGPVVVGTCCGATPDDTSILKQKISVEQQ
ncbi:MAG: homocysteine S-methyltransferase family protein [Candidatus Kariarchaeaceae archaeon]|jgi:homocysteine S-methyltransferase